MSRRLDAVSELERRLGYAFQNLGLLEQALTHPSTGHGGKRVSNNQVLEFLGDRVLSLLVADALVTAGPHWREGDLSQRQVALVSGSSCAAVARGLAVGPALRLDGSHAKQGGRDNDRVLGDAMEAVMAAVYLDGGLEAARGVFQRAWKEALEAAVGDISLDAKTALNQWAMARALPPPIYTITERSGPSHAPVFKVRVQVGDGQSEPVSGPTVRAAEQAAARAFLAGPSAA
jgi:ribonuclease-3